MLHPIVVGGGKRLFKDGIGMTTFRLLGGRRNGDVEGMPDAQLAVLLETSHTGAVGHAEVLLPTITAFLEHPCLSRANWVRSQSGSRD